MSRRHGSSRRTNLAAVASSFHGRERELAEVEACFDRARLVTLMGVGGAGKTRLAQEFGMRMSSTYARVGGVWFVDLTEVTTSPEFEEALRWTLAHHSSWECPNAGVDPTSDALDRLGPVLVILDNFEQLVPAAVAQVQRWIDTAEQMRLLVTSRAPLGLAAEQVLELPPLERSAAVTMLESRCRAVGTNITDLDALAGPIVDAIDRIPLAIELAASRTRLLSVTELRDRLQAPLDVLVADGRSHRHGSVRRAILDSLSLVSDRQRRLFALLSVFHDGFRVEDVEAVVGDVLGPTDRILADLEALRRVSLLVVERQETHARISLMQTVREAAVELGQDDPQRIDVVTRHARHYIRRARSIDRDTLLHDGDVANMIAAHEECGRRLDAGETQAAIDAFALVRALETTLTARGSSRVKLALFRSCVDATEYLEPSQAAELWLGMGRACRETGDTVAALADFARALELVSSIGRDDLHAEALVELGGIDDVVGETARARMRHAEALRLLEGDGPSALEIDARLGLGHALRREGKLAEARTQVVAALTRSRELDDVARRVAALYELGVLEMFERRFDEALVHFDEGERIAANNHLRMMKGAIATARGCVEQDRGDRVAARASHSAAARIFADCGTLHREGSALYYLATTCVEDGQPSEALPILTTAQERLDAVGSPRYAVLVASCRAAALAMCGDRESAELEHATAVRGLRQVVDEPSLESAARILGWVTQVSSGALRLEDVSEEARALAERHGNDDVRFAVRLLERLGRTPAVTADDAAALQVYVDGSGFWPPGATKVELLPEGSPLRGILRLLAARRTEAPGRRVTLDEIVAAGWPDEIMTTKSGLNRAHVALSTLRRKGLRPFLVKVAGGYAVSTAVRVTLLRVD